MPYAVYIDESGAFSETPKDGVRPSFIAGWIARHDNDHPELRAVLDDWRRRLGAPRLHAMEWRESSEGREVLDGVFQLLADQSPFGVIAIENRFSISTKDSRKTYLDMLVELLLDTLLFIRREGRQREAFPLRIYLAERMGQWMTEIDLLLKYRLRSLLVDSRDKTLIDAYSLHVRHLNLPAEKLLERESLERKDTGLMPEMALADFLCNALYHRNSLRVKPPTLNAGLWHVILFEEDPFWRDIKFFQSQGLWERMALEMTSRRGRQWKEEHPKVSNEMDLLLKQALQNCLIHSSSQIVANLKKEILSARDWEQARRLVRGLEMSLENAPLHLRPLVQWQLNMLGWDVANHMGDCAEAALRFQSFLDCLDQPQFRRLEFIREAPEFFNRHAVSLCDRYEFDAAEKILNHALAMEKRFLDTPVEVSGKEYLPEKSDSLGKIYSTLGQLYTKMAVRDPSLAGFALECIGESMRHLQASYEANRQRNYRIEALLVSGGGKDRDILQLLAEEGAFADAAAFFASMPPDSFDMLYWLRWLAVTEAPLAGECVKAVLGMEGAFLDIDGGSYPGMSVLYHFGRIAARESKKEAARRAWRKASQSKPAPGSKGGKAAGVLDTLRLRPLCALALAFPEEKETASQGIGAILEAIAASHLIDGGYFSRYPSQPPGGVYGDALLKELERDIPYS